jgi:DNA invertase Pin-like site-specific DNA recombinase
LEAQREAVNAYLNGGDWQIVDKYTEVESGGNSHPPALEKALAAARLHRASLVVSKVDRLTRSVAFLSRLPEAGVDAQFANLPQIEGATGRFLLQQMVAVAELEAGMISARTKAALAAARRRGKKFGGNRGVKPTAMMRAASAAVLQKRPNARSARYRSGHLGATGGRRNVAAGHCEQAERERRPHCTRRRTMDGDAGVAGDAEDRAVIKRKPN